MLVKDKILEFVRKNSHCVFLAVLLLFVINFSVSTFTVKPRFWVDEAVTVELAHNFLEFGKLDIKVAPGEFSGVPFLLQSTGYPLTLLLAVAFKFFGFSLVVERVVMLFLAVAFLFLLFSFGKKLFGPRQAILALLLTVSFASFYGSALTAVGEILGFIFLISGCFFWLFRRNFFWSGLFLGLSVVSKPSVFLLILPAVALALAFEREAFLRKIFKIGLGMIPAALAWVLLVVGDFFDKEIWLNIMDFYKNPYGSANMWSNVIDNLSGFWNSMTLIYFTILFVVVILARFWLYDEKQKTFFNFVICYSVLALLYYLRSPGWLRYILIAELLIIFVLPESLRTIFFRFRELIASVKISPWQFTIISVVFLSIIQFVNLFTASQIYASDAEIKTAALVNQKFPDKSVGIINALSLSVLVENNNKYQTVRLLGVPPLGWGFDTGGYQPQVMVSLSGRKAEPREKEILDKFYKRTHFSDGYEIYVKD